MFRSEHTIRPFAHRLANVLALFGLLVWNVAGWVHPLLHRHGHGESHGQRHDAGWYAAATGFACPASAAAARESESAAGASPTRATNCCCSTSQAASRGSVSATGSAETGVGDDVGIYGAIPASECSHLTCALCKLTKSTHALAVLTTDFVAALQLAATPVFSDLQPWCPRITTSARGPPTR